MTEFFAEILAWMNLHRQGFVHFSYFVLAVGMFQNAIYLLQLPLAALELFSLRTRDQESHTWWLSHSDITQPISILVPAYNEGVTIINGVHSTLALQYPIYEVIVINDGSTDDTLEKLIAEFQLEPSPRSYELLAPCQTIRQIYNSPIYRNLIVVDKVNGGGKADALNAGLNITRYPTFCTVDADSLLEPSALLKAVQPFIDDPEHTIAVGGTVRALNGCRVKNGVVTEVKLPQKLLARFQAVEYLRAFLMGRLAWNRLGILTIVSGAFAVLQREAAIAIGGFRTSNMGEDYDLILRLHRHMRDSGQQYNIEFVPEPVCWTEVPETLKVLRNQRVRWQQGALEGFFSNLGMFLNPRYGRIGVLAMPLSFVFDVLGPITEFSGYILIPLLYLIGIVELDIFLAFLGLLFVLGIFISVMSLVLEEMSLKRFPQARSLVKLALIAVLENFGYRQLNNVWRVVGWWRFLKKGKAWGDMTRVGI